MIISLEEIKQNQIELLIHSQNLLSRCDIQKIKEPFIIPTVDLTVDNQDEIKTQLKKFCSGSDEEIIYTISFTEPQSVLEVQQHFFNYKRKKIHALSKVNKLCDKKDLTSTLYVGSSKGKNLKTRMNNHFGVGSKGVYSMHLIHWLPFSIRCDIRIELHKMCSPSYSNDNINLLELIEQGMWDALKPLFGKRSGLL